MKEPGGGGIVSIKTFKREIPSSLEGVKGRVVGSGVAKDPLLTHTHTDAHTLLSPLAQPLV